MTTPLLQIIGRRQYDDGTVNDLLVTVFVPVADPQHHNARCRIRMPSLFAADKHIFGVDEAQAVELAIGFVRQMFDYRHIDVTAVRRPGQP